MLPSASDPRPDQPSDELVRCLVRAGYGMVVDTPGLESNPLGLAALVVLHFQQRER